MRTGAETLEKGIMETIRSMKALAYGGPGKMTFQEKPLPKV